MKCKYLIVRSFILIFLLISFSCNRENKADNKPKPRLSKETLEEVNKLLVDKDSEIIKSFVERRGWDMNVSETGLWYIVDKEGTGDKIEKNNFVTLNYKLWLIDGTLCYSSDSLGTKKFVVGKGGVEAGLEEGVLMLKSGSKARFIMPPHLAHGLMGDENRIPARAIIIYDIEVLNIED